MEEPLTLLAAEVATMPTKNHGILAIIYATDELQHPLPHYTMLSEADMDNLTGRSDTRAHSYASSLSNQHCLKGEGFTVELLSLERERSPKFLKMQRCSHYFWQALYL